MAKPHCFLCDSHTDKSSDKFELGKQPSKRGQLRNYLVRTAITCGLDKSVLLSFRSITFSRSQDQLQQRLCPLIKKTFLLLELIDIIRMKNTSHCWQQTQANIFCNQINTFKCFSFSFSNNLPPFTHEVINMQQFFSRKKTTLQMHKIIEKLT